MPKKSSKTFPIIPVITQKAVDENTYIDTNQAYIDSLDKMPIYEDEDPSKEIIGYIVTIDIRRLVLDRVYQLESRENRDGGLLKKWDMRKCQPITVNLRRTGHLSTIDGVHRCQAAIRHGITHLKARIFFNLKLEEEVALFVTQSDCVVPVRPNEIFLALVRSGNPDKCIMNAIFNKYGFEVRESWKKKGLLNKIGAVNFIEKQREDFVHEDGTPDDAAFYAALTWVFDRLQRNVWGHITAATGKDSITCLFAVYKDGLATGRLDEYAENLDKVMFIYGPEHFFEVARGACANKGTAVLAWRIDCFIKVARDELHLNDFYKYMAEFRTQGLWTSKHRPNKADDDEE